MQYEGANGDLMAGILLLVWLGGPLVVMGVVTVRARRGGPHLTTRLIGGALLLVPLSILAVQLLPSVRSNADLLLPTFLLGAFIVLLIFGDRGARLRNHNPAGASDRSVPSPSR